MTENQPTPTSEVELRDKLAEIVWDGMPSYDPRLEDAEETADYLLPVVAAYVAAERERVLAPIRALAGVLEGEADEEIGGSERYYVLHYAAARLRAVLPPITQAAASVASPADHTEGKP